MRHFLLVLMTSWLIGITLGVLDAPDIFVNGAIVIAFIFLFRTTFQFQIGIAVVVLIFLGYIWGEASAATQNGCTELESTVQGVITHIHRIEQSDAVYRVASNNSSCKYLVTTSRFPKYNVQDVVEIEGRVQAVADIPEQYKGYAEYLARMGIDATIQYPTVTVVVPSKQPSFKESVSVRINKLFPEPEASILQAMLLARVGAIPESIENQFQHTNVSHILAISGSNISLLAGSLIAFLLLLPMPSFLRVFISIVAVWMYIAMIDYQVSAVRAALFWTAGIVGTYVHVLLSLTTVIILIFTLMVSINPLIILDVGFQLSFAAIVGIGAAVFLSRSEEIIKRRHMAILLVLASLGAMLTTWPLIMHYFGTFSIIGLPANILIVPLTSLFVLSGLVSIISSYIFFPLGLVGSFITHGTWFLMNAITRTFASIPNMYLENKSLPLWAIVTYYIALALFAIWTMKKSNRSWKEVWQ